MCVTWHYAARTNARRRLELWAQRADFDTIPSIAPYACAMVGAMQTGLHKFESPNFIFTEPMHKHLSRALSCSTPLRELSWRWTRMPEHVGVDLRDILSRVAAFVPALLHGANEQSVSLYRREAWPMTDSAAAALQIVFGGIALDNDALFHLDELQNRITSRRPLRYWEHQPAYQAVQIMALVGYRVYHRRAGIDRDRELSPEDYEAIFAGSTNNTVPITLGDVEGAFANYLAARKGGAWIQPASDRYEVGMRVLHLYDPDPEMPTLIRRYWNIPLYSQPGSDADIIDRIRREHMVRELGEARADAATAAFEWVRDQKLADHPNVEGVEEHDSDYDSDQYGSETEEEPGEEYDSNYETGDESSEVDED